MKFTILGAGGTGGTLAAKLGLAGADVSVIARGDHLQAIQNNGLILEYADGTQNTVQIKASDKLTETPDVMFVCVKDYGLEDAMPTITEAAEHGAVIVPLLNVIDAGKRIAAHIPEDKAGDGCIYVTAAIKEPGVIKLESDILRVFFGYDETLVQAAEQMRSCGIDAVCTKDIMYEKFRKFSFIAPMAACSAYYDCNAGRIQTDPEVRECFKELVAEIAEIAEASGYKLPDDIVEIQLRLMDSLDPGVSASLVKDLRAGHQAEIEGLIQWPGDMAKRLRMSTPVFAKIAISFTNSNLSINNLKITIEN